MGLLRRRRDGRATPPPRGGWPERTSGRGPALLVLVFVLLLAVGMLLTGVRAADAQSVRVLVARIGEPITPVIADHLTDGVDQAAREGHAAFVVELDTPGGLDASMREITQTFLNAPVPVVVHVTPSGARAASAGAIITMAAHVAAMTPGTTIGAATPVDLQGGEISDKVINDAAAFAESVAAQRGRDTRFAAEAVRQGRAVTAEQAYQIGVVDLLAPDRAALLQALDGRQVTLARGGTVTLHTAGAQAVEHDLGLVRGLLQRLADPNLAFVFLSIGTLAVIYELASPGMGLGGVLGAILLVLGFVALAVLPVNLAGLLLLGLAAALFVAELFLPGVGVFAGGGVIALLAAGLLLFEGSAQVSLAVLLPTVVVLGVGVLIAGRLAWRARNAPPTTGQHALIGRPATVRNATEATAQIFLDGTWWSVRSHDQPLEEGETVVVVGMDGLTLLVEPIQPNPTKEPRHV